MRSREVIFYRGSLEQLNKVSSRKYEQTEQREFAECVSDIQYLSSELKKSYDYIREKAHRKNIDAVVDFRTSISINSRGNYILLGEGTPVRLKE